MFHLKDTDLFLKVRKPIAVNDREEAAMELARKIKRRRLSNDPHLSLHYGVVYSLVTRL